ncbi:MAG TPA: hypothetical protein DCY27_03295 [Desulfobacterales bacterium]|jgi:sialic acid synthase SpsE|nr:hypothetical protein [Desulfobacterales bacterium]
MWSNFITVPRLLLPEGKGVFMRSEISIGHKTISEYSPLFIIAETGVTCNYDLNIAKELIDVVAESGADAIKFIFWFPEEIMSDKTITYSYDSLEGPKTENMFDMLNQLRFSLDEWRELKAYGDKRKVIIFSTVNSPSGIEYAETLGLEAYKLSSWDYNYLPLWRRIAALKKPVIIDTGPVKLAEMAKVMQLMLEAQNDQCILLHCTSADSLAEKNMGTIPYLRDTFHALVGYSSRDCHDETDIMAVALGAVVLEKRLTLARNLPGHHHILSKEPGEFADYVRLIRQVQAAKGRHELNPSQKDLIERRKWFRHLVANQDIPQGTKLTPEMLEGKRPEPGVSPEYLDFFVGRVTKRPLKYNEAISWDDI